MGESKIAVSEIQSHNKEEDCWIVVDGQVWDITQFAPEHPGGPAIIYKYAGRDATEAYGEIHAPSIIKNGLPENAHKGTVDEATITKKWSEPLPSAAPKAASKSVAVKPPLDGIINSHDFELVAKNSATAKTWAFYSSASNDLITRDANNLLYNRIFFRPRTMRKVMDITTKTTLLGKPVSFPLFVSPAAMARLIHPDGELAIGRACKTRNVIQSISNNASYGAADIVSQSEVLDHPFIFQLYVDKRKEKTNALLAQIKSHKNISAIMVTVDAAAAGKREADERVKADESIENPMQKNKPKNDSKGGGYGRLMGSFIDPNLSWAYISWLRGEIGYDMPMLTKGVMSADDVKMALDIGLDGCVLSNHGGRNLDTSPPPILVLLEIHARFPEIVRDHHPQSASAKAGLTKPFSILIDGGIRRGTDILKCVCLGAVSVGIGRPVLYATGYGQEGVEHLIDIYRDEFEVAMRNVGLTSIEQCGPEYVNTGDIDHMVCKSTGHPYAASWSAQVTRQSKL
ncbi:hypothetical protein LTR70_009471 [Exophiala xenobiotica]|uniref:L-lactate dehydrogenase (Cytochrome) n=1 Tax=Lithohypha guttulata TaxID=1690604 RepID=A0ABR0JXJ1_9EURO|nr:hypothetical protein LTR24_009367 [Lithohypha guttulata]KAK5310447.1 hypothetical protein LTR70_009471 [Exophiala xenobiotica]